MTYGFVMVIGSMALHLNFGFGVFIGHLIFLEVHMLFLWESMVCDPYDLVEAIFQTALELCFKLVIGLMVTEES